MRVNEIGHKIADSFKGEYANLHNYELEPIRQELLQLKNRISTAQKKAMATFDENLSGLNAEEMDLFGRMRLLDDLMWRKENRPDAELPFDFDEESLKAEHERFKKFVEESPKVKKAIEA